MLVNEFQYFDIHKKVLLINNYIDFQQKCAFTDQIMRHVKFLSILADYKFYIQFEKFMGNEG